MKHLLILAAFGALGTVLRYQVVTWIGEREFPWATFTVNIIGSALMGLMYVLIQEKALLDASLKPYLTTALLGAFTTFSTFSLDTFRLLESGAVLVALSYVLASVVLCFIALSATIYLTRSLV